MTFWKWSKVAATNATADSTCPFPEGMSASALNDGTRAMMAAAAKFRDDISGANVTAGTLPFYTITSNQGFPNATAMNGQLIAFTPHATNTGPSQLAVDGIATFLRLAPGIDLPAGSIIAGTPYVATYYSASTELIIHGGGFSNPYNIPLGSGIDYWGVSPPNSAFAFPFGQAISRTTYASLFAIFGTSFGAGDGTTFNLPDKRGRVSAGCDNMGGTAANVLPGGSLNLRVGTTTQALGTANLPPYTPSGGVSGSFSGTATNGQIILSTSGTGTSVVPSSAGGQTDGRGLAVSGPISATFTGTAQGGTSTAFSILQPTVAVNYILRII